MNQSQYPTEKKPEAAFVGRSNVGKSSLLNYLVNRKSLARTSSSPGKTRGINFYNVEDKLYFVDLPGYGYAKVSRNEKDFWAKMINEYLHTREELKLIVLLVDIRHQPTELDHIMLEWIRHSGLDLVVAATKADKITKSAISEQLEVISKALVLTEMDTIIPVSSSKKFGRDELWEVLREKLRV